MLFPPARRKPPIVGYGSGGRICKVRHGSSSLEHLSHLGIGVSLSPGRALQMASWMDGVLDHRQCPSILGKRPQKETNVKQTAKCQGPAGLLRCSKWQSNTPTGRRRKEKEKRKENLRPGLPRISATKKLRFRGSTRRRRGLHRDISFGDGRSVYLAERSTNCSSGLKIVVCLTLGNNVAQSLTFYRPARPGQRLPERVPRQRHICPSLGLGGKVDAVRAEMTGQQTENQTGSR